MIVRTDEELAGLKKIGRICALAREEMKKSAKPGMTTKELDDIGRKVLEMHGAVSAPEEEYDFPGATCISVNEEVAHGIPGERVLQDGDLVNIDVSAVLDGFYADTGVSFVIGNGIELKYKLCEVAQSAFEKGALKAKAGARKNQLGRAVANEARANGLHVIQNLTGHGVGRSLHEAPDHILNYFDPQDSALLKEGMVIAFEPFISEKDEYVVEQGDGWTFMTPDKSLVAQYEHTIVITKGKPIILTALDEE